MKIKSINFKESDRYYVTFNTEPKLRQLVFDRFKTLATNEPELENCLPELSATPALKLFFGKPVGSTLPVDFLQKVEQILTAAESFVQNEADAKKS